MAKREVDHIDEKKCGCRLTVYMNEKQDYEPCLVHALEGAGKMLIAAASRWDELLKGMREDAVKMKRDLEATRYPEDQF